MSQPILQGLEGSKVGHRIGQDYPHRASVVGLGDGLEFLLPGSVPDLKSYAFAVYVDGLYLEVDAWVGEGVPIVERWEVMKLF